MTSSNLVALMLTFFALSMGQSFALDSNLFGGRNQFLCGGNTDIVKLIDGESKEGALVGNLLRRYSFNVPSAIKFAECTTTGISGSGEVDLYICDESDATACMADPHAESVSPGSSTETVTTSPEERTWYVIVKGNVDPVAYSVKCVTKNIF